jgi:hypothetical protein
MTIRVAYEIFIYGDDDFGDKHRKSDDFSNTRCIDIWNIYIVSCEFAYVIRVAGYLG